MSDDLLSLVTGGQQSFAPAAVPKQVRTSRPTFADDTDAMIRTVYGEADPQGRQAVAAVIRNRAQASGKGIADVVTEPGQFEAWQRPDHAARMMALKPDSPEYKQIAAEIAPVLAGKIDPTGGADSYYAPKLQADLGRNKPAWDDGTGQQIGSQLYFKGKYAGGSSSKPSADDDLLSMVTGGKASFSSATPGAVADGRAQSGAQPAADAPRVANEFVVQGNGKPSSAMNPAQLKTYQQLAAAGVIDTKKTTQATDAGTLKMPYVQTDADVIPEGPGVYYVDMSGKLQQTPGKPVGHGEGLAEGAKQGVLDVYGSMANLEKGLAKVNPILGAASNANINPFIKYSPFYSDEEKARAGGQGGAFGMMSENEQAARDAFNARYGASGYATTGRIAGNIAASAPIMATGGGALTAAGEASPVGAFLAGQAGRAPGIGNLLLRGGSLAARGAIEGAEGAGLTSSASDAPLEQQLSQGAMLGGGLGVAAPALIGGAKGVGTFGQRLVEPFTEGGQQKIVNRLINKFAEGGPTSVDTTELVAGSRPTLAQATQNPGIAALERGARATPTGSSLFRNVDEANAQARGTMFDAMRGDRAAMEALAQERDQAALPMLRQAMENAQPANPVNVVNRIDEILSGPAKQRDAVKGALKDVKEKLVQKGPMGMAVLESDPQQLYGIRQAINDSLSPLARGTTADKRLASSELLQVRDEIDKAIEEAAPGFRGYLSKYAELSKPVNEANYLQSLDVVDSKGNITLGKMDNALKRIEKARNASGINDAKSLSADTLKGLYALRDDLRRETSGSGVGKFVGSNTFQNLATNEIVNKLGVPMAFGVGTLAHNPVAGLGLAAAKMAYGSKNEEIQNRLISTLLNPENANLKGGSISLGGGNPIPISQVNKLTSTVKNQLVPAAVIGSRNVGDTTGRRKSQPEALNYPIGY